MNHFYLSGEKCANIYVIQTNITVLVIILFKFIILLGITEFVKSNTLDRSTKYIDFLLTIPQLCHTELLFPAGKWQYNFLSHIQLF